MVPGKNFPNRNIGEHSILAFSLQNHLEFFLISDKFFHRFRSSILSNCWCRVHLFRVFVFEDYQYDICDEKLAYKSSLTTPVRVGQ